MAGFIAWNGMTDFYVLEWIRLIFVFIHSGIEYIIDKEICVLASNYGVFCSYMIYDIVENISNEQDRIWDGGLIVSL